MFEWFWYSFKFFAGEVLHYLYVWLYVFTLGKIIFVEIY